jgi:hypothetical protein
MSVILMVSEFSSADLVLLQGCGFNIFGFIY